MAGLSGIGRLEASENSPRFGNMANMTCASAMVDRLPMQLRGPADDLRDKLAKLPMVPGMRGQAADILDELVRVAANAVES